MKSAFFKQKMFFKLPFESAVIDTTGGQPKLQKREYLSEGAYPVIDQSQEAIAGYTDDSQMLYQGSLPVILFGDHTRIFKYVDFPFVLGADGVKVLTSRDYYNTKFIYFYFQSNSIPSRGYSRHFKFLKEITIPFFVPSEQRRIVEILDQADALRKMRAEADAKSDRILPALFIKMFGDPSTNPMGWDVDILGNFLTDIESGWSPKCESREAAAEEWGVLKLSSVTSGKFKPTENKALLPGDSPRPNLEVKPGDLLFTRKNTHDLVGASAFVYNTRPRLMLPDIIFRLCTSNELDPVYLWQLLSQKAMRYQLSALSGGTAGSMPNISKARLRTLSIPVPPINLQLKYREISNRFWETQQNQKTTTQIINSLFDSLLQRAFSGELTAKWREANMKELLLEMEEQAKVLNLVNKQDKQQLSFL